MHFSGTRGGAAFGVSDFSYSIRPEDGPTIRLNLNSPRDAARLIALSRANLGAHIAVTIEGKTSYMPADARLADGNSVALTFSDPTTFSAVKDALENRHASRGLRVLEGRAG